jgi:hypothetical protein
VKGGIMGEKWPIKFSLTITTSTEIVRDFFLHAAKLRHWIDGFTSPPKEGVLGIIRPKNPTDSDGFEPASTPNTRPLKLLDCIWLSSS